jgi:predicted metal-dependent peptidase
VPCVQIKILMITKKQDKLNKIQQEVLDKIIVARVGLLLRHPFFGNMATRLGIQECDDWCPTAATDGRNLYYNTSFFNKLSAREIEFVIAHEILHCVFDHIGRTEQRDRQIYNIACDYIVNNTLVRDSIGEKPKDIPIFQDFKYEGFSSEKVYDEIYKKYDEKQLSKLGKLLDEHLDWNDDNSDGAGKDGKDKTTGDKQKPSFSKEELRKIRDEIKDSILQSAQAAGAGNLPKEVERIVKSMTNPKMNWKEILQTQIQSTVKSDYSFMRPSRKGWHSGVVLPGSQFEQTIDVAVAIDTSGSISEKQLSIFLGEIKNIMDQYKDYRIKVWCFDTEVYNEQTFTPYEGDISQYKIEGGGGTDFMCNWEYMKANDIVPHKLIMFTDGYTFDSWGDAYYCDTVFVIHDNHNENIEAPFGVTTSYED